MKTIAIATTSLLALCLALPATAQGPDQYGDTGNSTPAAGAPAPGPAAPPESPTAHREAETAKATQG